MWVDIFYKKYRSTFLKRVLFKKHGPGSNGSRQVLQKPTSTAIGESNLGNSQIRNSKIQFVEKTSTRFSVEKARCFVDQVGERNRKGRNQSRRIVCLCVHMAGLIVISFQLYVSGTVSDTSCLVFLTLFLHYTPPPVRASLSLASVHSHALRLISFHLTTNTCFSVVVVRVQKHSLTTHTRTETRD